MPITDAETHNAVMALARAERAYRAAYDAQADANALFDPSTGNLCGEADRTCMALIMERVALDRFAERLLAEAEEPTTEVCQQIPAALLGIRDHDRAVRDSEWRGGRVDVHPKVDAMIEKSETILPLESK